MSGLKIGQAGCCCGPASCVLTVTSTETGLCTTNSPADFGLWTSSFGVAVPTPTIAITNSAGTSVTNRSSQPAGSYTAVATVPRTLCAMVNSHVGGSPESICISYAAPATTVINHVCPDSTHTIPSPAFTGWQVALFAQSLATSNDAGCGSQTGPSGTGTTSDGQTFAIPGSAILNSVGSNLTITGTYSITGTLCCSSNGPATPLFDENYTVTGTFAISFCNGPCAIFSFGADCYQTSSGVVVSAGPSGAGAYYCTNGGIVPGNSITGTQTSGMPYSPSPPVSSPAISRSMSATSTVSSPSLLTMAGNLAQAVAGHAANGFSKSTPEVLEARLAICQGCPLFNSDNKSCNKCGCNLPIKASWESSVCPEGHW